LFAFVGLVIWLTNETTAAARRETVEGGVDSKRGWVTITGPGEGHWLAVIVPHSVSFAFDEASGI
jgi:hypothetical protein